jgi:hypothetical protein
MLIPDYLAIGTLVILIFGAWYGFIRKGGLIAKPGSRSFWPRFVIRRYRSKPRPKEYRAIRFVEPRPNDHPKPFSRQFERPRSSLSC